MRMAVLFRTHLINRHVMAEFERIRTSCSQFADVWMLYHSESNWSPPSVQQCFLFSTSQIQEMGFPFRDFWHEGHYPVLMFARRNPQYDYYWMLEYDVRFTGDWWQLLSSYIDNDKDFLAAYISTLEQDPTWPWFFDLNFECDEKYWRRSFFPVVRFSARALRMLDNCHSQGQGGHCEAVTPCLLLLNGLTVGDLNEGRQPVYTPETYSPEYRYVPFIRTQPNMLYHPAYGLTTRKGMVHLIHRMRKRLNLLELKPRAKRYLPWS
jgi:hypothetical protein